MFKLLTLFCLLCMWGTSYAQSASLEPNDQDGEIRYVTDELQTFLHAGPGRNYRILGTVIAGTRVTQLQVDKENGFIEVIDDRQRTGWVDAEFITAQKSLREIMPGLQQELTKLDQALTSQQSKSELLNQQIVDLSSQNNLLKKQLATLEAENADVNHKLATQDQTAQMEWLTRGGIIALVSIILGVIIAYLPKKRRRNDQWM
jgi:SH3 domain protein